MNFSLTEEELMIYNTASEFGENEVKPSVRERDDNEVWATDLWKKMGNLGFLALPYDEQYGGGNANAFKTVLAMEGFGYGAEDAGLALAWGAHTILCGIPIFKLGTNAQKQKYLPKMASGEWIGGFCLTEPGSGSDAAGMKTTAIKKDGYYLLNGSKTFITNAPVGHHFVVTAITNPGHKSFGISTFIVEKNFTGFSVGKNMNKMGMRTSTTSEVFFDNCEVPEENLLGQENLGFVQTVKLILGWERCCLLAPAVGGLKKLGEKCLKYSTERQQFNRPILKFQAIQKMIANMKVDYEISKNLLYKVAWLIDSGHDEEIIEAAAICKTYITEASQRCGRDAIQIHGGNGFMKEYQVERFLRDAMVGTIGGGTSEVQRGIIARSMMNI